jgi:hypothetical protein
MFEKCKFLIEIKKIRKNHSRIVKKNVLFEHNSKPYVNNEELSSLYSENVKVENWISFIQTQYYKKKFEKLMLLMPEIENTEYYFEYNFDDEEGVRQILTRKGFHFIKSLLDDYYKKKREIISFWFTITIGLIGALIGLISILKN